VLNFWASWCGPCMMELPHFEDKYQQWGDQVQFLMVNVTASDVFEDARAFIESKGYQFPVFYDHTGEAAAAYNVSSIPITFFITREGEIKYSYLGSMSKKDLQHGIDVLLVK
jgi:thiol-disulfide isomerase/thioredoxin